MKNGENKGGRSYGGGNYGSRQASSMRSSTPLEIKGILGSALRQYGLDQDIARYSFVNNWAEIVGPEIAKRSRPECLRNGALIVRVTSSAWAQELSFQSQVILTRLKKFLSQDQTVTEISFCVGDLG